jgi:RNA polymerase primary sigma factor
VSSHARKLLPAEVLSHPSITALVASGTPTGTVSPEDVRRASDEAGVEPRHLKALLVHLGGVGISVQVDATSLRAVAATSKRAATSATAKKAPAKPAAKKSSATEQDAGQDAEAPQKGAAKKTAAKKAPAKKAAPVS